MKIIITESQQTQLIGEAIMENFPEVVSINYSTRKVQLVNMGNKIIDVKVINVITDPYKVLEGNLNNKLGKYEFEDLFKNIRQFVERYFSINLFEYGSEFRLVFYVLGTLDVHSLYH